LSPIDLCFRLLEQFPRPPRAGISIGEFRGDSESWIRSKGLALYDGESCMVLLLPFSEDSSLIFRFCCPPSSHRRALPEILWALLIRSTSGVGVNKNIPPFTNYRYLSAALTKKAPSQKYPVRWSLGNEMKIQTNDLKQVLQRSVVRGWRKREERKVKWQAGREPGREFDWG